jgi:hypothetical protein
VAKYLFSYQQPRDYVPGTDPDAIAAWQGFFEGMADRVVDPGQPVFEASAIGDVGESTKLGGYSVVDADSLDDAVALAKGCPTLRNGGGVQVGELTEVPPDHIAARLRSRLSGA